MAAHGSLGNERAGVVNRLFYAVGGLLILVGNVRPDVENICFGQWGKDVRKISDGWWPAMPQNSGKFNYSTFR